MPIISGTTGNDDLTATAGVDTIDGGAGDDKLTLDRSTLNMSSPVTLNFTPGSSTAITLPDGTSFVNIEHLFLKTGPAYDHVTFTQPLYDTTWGGNSWDGGTYGDGSAQNIATVNLSLDTNGLNAAYQGDTFQVQQRVNGTWVNTVSLTHVLNLELFGGTGPNTFVTSTGYDTLNGGPGNDLLSGGESNDTLRGFGGIDTLLGGTGNDNISALGGGSTIDGGSGYDHLSLDLGNSSSSKTFSFDARSSTPVLLSDGTSIANIEHLGLTTGSGNDNVAFKNIEYVGDLGSNTWDAGAGNDTATIDYSSAPYYGEVKTNWTSGNCAVSYVEHSIVGGDFGGTALVLSNVENVNILAGAANDTLIGGNGNDTLSGGLGNDFLSGGLGLDTASYATAPAGVIVDLNNAAAQNTGGAGVDTVRGIENVIGSDYGDTLTGDPGNNILDGGIGTNYISGSGGDDYLLDRGLGSILDGGGGSDLLYLYRGTSVGSISFTFKPGSIMAVSLPDLTTFIGIEILSLNTGSGDDTITFDNPIRSDTWGGSFWDGGAGTDTAIVSMSGDTPGFTTSLDGSGLYHVTQSGNDVVMLSHIERFNITGGSGGDTLVSSAGDDTLNGGSGTDTVSYASAASGVTVSLAVTGAQAVGGGQGNDTLISIENITGSLSGDTLTGGADANVLNGGDGNDRLVGGAGNDTLSGGAGSDTLSGGEDEDRLTGGTGDDALDGGSSVDTAVVSGARSAYTITQTSTGNFTVAGPDGTDTLTNVEYLAFDDQMMRLLPGTGTSVNWSADPSTYMAGIRDFDGNNLGGASSWKLIGTADVNGDNRAEHILFNRAIGRWAEVGTEADGLTYFANNGWAGDTRVVGIYIDPLVANGTVIRGSDTDSQRRFQNDLTIDNIKSVLGQADYDHNGLQEVYFSLTDGTAYLHAYMHADGNIQYANYQSKQQVIDYLTSNGIASSTWSTWFPASQSAMEIVAADPVASALPGTTAWSMVGPTGG